MDVYVARQPIFDKKMNIYGYELLYRRSMQNFYEGNDCSKSTAEIISNSFFAMDLGDLTDGTRAFINFPQTMIEDEIPALLPKETIVIEILEGVEVRDKLINTCKNLRELGYVIALDDFLNLEKHLPLLEIADIVKIEFSEVKIDRQIELIQKYGHRIKFLAEKVETREEYEKASKMGYNLFQGFFFSRPVIVVAKEVTYLNETLVKMNEELHKSEPDFERMNQIIQKDLGLVYKLLKLVNSVFYATRGEIESIKQALVRLGTKELKKWVYVMMLKEIQVVGNRELIKNSLIRAKLMESLSVHLGLSSMKTKFFMTGLFSSIDVLLNRDMEKVLLNLPFQDDVKCALLGKNNILRETLDIVLKYEKARWEELDRNSILTNMQKDKFVKIYIHSLRWVKKLNDEI